MTHLEAFFPGHKVKVEAGRWGLCELWVDEYRRIYSRELLHQQNPMVGEFLRRDFPESRPGLAALCDGK